MPKLADKGQPLLQVIHIPLEKIFPGPFQRRKDFNETGLEELAESIRTHGVKSPILLRIKDKNLGTFEIVYGERRFRASKLAEKSTIPAMIEELTDQLMSEISLTENLHRQSLTPIEEANWIHDLMDHFQIDKKTTSQRIGKSPNFVEQRLALLKLPPMVQDFIHAGKISLAHAEVILEIEEREWQEKAAELAAAGKLNAAQLKGRMQGKIKRKAEFSENRSSGVTFEYVNGLILRLYEALEQFDPSRVIDSNKRDTLERNLETMDQVLDELGKKFTQEGAQNLVEVIDKFPKDDFLQVTKLTVAMKQQLQLLRKAVQKTNNDLFQSK